jgi:hypothetical protein
MQIIYQNVDGRTSVVIPAPNTGHTIEQIAEKGVPHNTPYAIVDASVIPTDRTYRNAWVADLVNGSIGHDMPKAREIHKNYMRRARTPLLADLDTQYMRADEAGNGASKAQIAAQKQALRDVTADPGIAAAQTVEELKQVWPSILGPNPLV